VRVLVDTTVWSLAFRRKTDGRTEDEECAAAEWKRLVGRGSAVLCGPIRQELLTGIREEAPFERLRTRLRWFPDETMLVEDYEEAARCRTRCLQAGIAASAADMAICALAIRRDLPVFTTDPDFTRYARVLPLRLHRPRK
jgi:predicted nucleic acid-binding protein